MKVALCMSGQMRTYKRCYGYLYENILHPLDPDVFIHTWKNKGSTTKTSPNRNHKSKVKKESLKKLYKPRSVKIEKFENEWFLEKDGIIVPEKLMEATDHWKGSIPMFYKIKKCNDLKSIHEKEKDFEYDIVIKIRPDLVVPKKIPERVLNRPSVLWYSGAHIDTEEQISDKFALSSSKNMDYYSSVWEKLNKYWENPLGNGNWKSIRVGERLMRYHMSKCKVDTKPFSIGCNILRDVDFALEKGKEAAREEAKRNPKIPLSNIAVYFEKKLSSLWSKLSL